MSKPVILTLDDDVNVLRAVERDLRSQYGADYRIVRADSGSTALEMLDDLSRRGETSALFLVDQRMPNMSGVEFLAKAIEVYPDARRVLLTAYADTDAAINAINEVQIDHYLLKPWDPPEEKLYPVLTDLLEDWLAAYHPPVEGIRLMGHQWAPDSYRVKDFLARNQIPYVWLNLEVSEEGRKLVDAQNGGAPTLPCLFTPEGVCLHNPTNREIAECVGCRRSPTNRCMISLSLGRVRPALPLRCTELPRACGRSSSKNRHPAGRRERVLASRTIWGFPAGYRGRSWPVGR